MSAYDYWTDRQRGIINDPRADVLTTRALNCVANAMQDGATFADALRQGTAGRLPNCGKVTMSECAALLEQIEPTTQGIETRQSGDAKQAPSRSDESPVGGNADAPNPNSNRPTQGSGGGAEARARELLAEATGLGMEAMRPENDSDRVLQSSALRAIEAALSSTPSNTQGALERSGVYVASRASIPERGQMWRELRASGVKVNSTWIDEDGEGETGDWSELWRRIEREVKASEALILYAEPDDFPLKGAFVEAGIAIASGVPVYIVAPGVPLGSYGCRPIGSWASHPLVTYADSVDQALLGLKSGEAGL